ncbi:hypothetical protein EON65_47985 [archaeon]|nr:MAG: hypothetical protein EON65_47985 [archaeon]
MDFPPPLIDPELIKRVQCFACGETGGPCRCVGQPPGANRQFLLNDDDLPSRDASIEDHIEFWGYLLPHGPISSQFNAQLFYHQELLENGILDLIKDSQIQQDIYAWIHAYVNSEHFSTVVAPAFRTLGVEKLKQVPVEALDSFFAGRWYELCPLHIDLIMNAVNLQGPNPSDSSSARYVKVIGALQAIAMVLGWMSRNPAFSLCASERLTHMRQMAVYTRSPVPTQPAENRDE